MEACLSHAGGNRLKLLITSWALFSINSIPKISVVYMQFALNLTIDNQEKS